MKKKINLSKNIQIIIVVAVILFAVFLINHFTLNSRIKQANINGYMFLKKVSSCTIQYKINVMTGETETDFKQECLEDALSYLRKIPFAPGEIGGEKLLVDSEEYNHCYYIRSLKGVEAYDRCIEEILPILEKKYPEVVER